MKLKNVYLGLVAAIASAGFTYAGDTFKADATHAHIGFKVSHLVVSKVKGQFTDFDSTLVLDESGNLSSVKTAVTVNSVDTANKKRDDHLRGPDFFDVAKFPEITFESTSVEKRDGKDVVVGTFTLHGVSKEVALPYSVKGPVKDPWGNTKLGFETAITIDRTDYGLTWSKALETGGLVVGNEVEIEIDVEYAKQ